MAVNPAPLPEFHAVPGVRLGTADAAIKKPGSDDLVVMELAEGSAAGAVFTRNAFRAAPVLVAEQALAIGFYISISGIVTFKNAGQVAEVAARVPLDRLLIETDAPF